MKAALAGLTTRGRSFLAAGVAAILCALALGENDLLRVGVLLLALPLVAVGFVVRSRYRLACRRGVEPSRVTAGRDAQVTMHLDNVSRLPTGLLLVEDHIPYVLGGRPRFVLDRVEPRGSRQLSYRVRSDVRGKFRLGPLSVRLADPLGLVELTRSFAAVDTLTVTPVITSLPRVKLVGDWAGGGDSRARTVAAAGEDDVSPREYRHGDDLRRVHWRSTARHGELMVRREEQHWQSRGAVLLDTRRIVHRGEGPASSFEWAVSAAASVAIHLVRSGFGLRFLTDAGEITAGLGVTGGRSGAFEGVLLDALTVVRPSRHRFLRDGVQALLREGGEGLVVAVLGALDPAEARELAAVHGRGGHRIAFVLDISSWNASSAVRHPIQDSHEEAVATLRRSGWRVVPVAEGCDLASAWSTAGAISAAPAPSLRAAGSSR
ncbi:MAG: DUF58 domain-containing protein [Streptosporangiales bacterium]|nr:DUF58 domain-containing protein [Streptosporangiales bacterium]